MLEMSSPSVSKACNSLWSAMVVLECGDPRALYELWAGFHFCHLGEPVNADVPSPIVRGKRPFGKGSKENYFPSFLNRNESRRWYGGNCFRRSSNLVFVGNGCPSLSSGPHMDEVPSLSRVRVWCVLKVEFGISHEAPCAIELFQMPTQLS
jgi:hypothetical protein